jgi:hypothetical protein
LQPPHLPPRRCIRWPPPHHKASFSSAPPGAFSFSFEVFKRKATALARLSRRILWPWASTDHFA